MSSSDKIVYAPRAESGHAYLRKVRSTWPKVIATESYLARWHPSAYGLGFSLPRSTAHDHLQPRATNLTLAVHSPAFVSLRVSYYSYTQKKIVLQSTITLSFERTHLYRGLKARDSSFESTKSRFESTIHCVGWSHDYRIVKRHTRGLKLYVLRASTNFRSSAPFCALVCIMEYIRLASTPWCACWKTAVHFSYYTHHAR